MGIKNGINSGKRSLERQGGFTYPSNDKIPRTKKKTSRIDRKSARKATAKK